MSSRESDSQGKALGDGHHNDGDLTTQGRRHTQQQQVGRQRCKRATVLLLQKQRRPVARGLLGLAGLACRACCPQQSRSGETVRSTIALQYSTVLLVAGVGGEGGGVPR